MSFLTGNFGTLSLTESILFKLILKSSYMKSNFFPNKLNLPEPAEIKPEKVKSLFFLKTSLPLNGFKKTL